MKQAFRPLSLSGPFAAIVSVFRTANTVDDAEVPVWILVLGGAGITVGLATLGYKVMQAIGVSLTRITPSRGFAIELGAAAVVVGASRIGIPVSTTHCQVRITSFLCAFSRQHMC